MTKNATTLALVTFAALLGVFLLTREGTVNEGVPRLNLPPLTPAAITALEVAGQAALTREEGGWKVADPKAPTVKFPADEAQVTPVLEQLAALRASDFVTQKAEKHAGLGLDAAQGTALTVSTAGGKVLELVFGKTAATGGAYLRMQGSDAVFITSSPVGGSLKRGVSSWRKKTVPTASASELEQLTVTDAQGGSFTLAAGEGGAWSLQSPAPPGFRFDAAAAQRLAQSVSNPSAQDFAQTDDAPLGLAGPHRTIALKVKGGRTVTLELGTPQADQSVPLRVAGEPQVYLLAQWTARPLLQSLEGLRDTTLLSFKPAEVKQLSVTAAGKKTVVAREAGGWKLVEPKVAPAGLDFDPQQVDAALSRLQVLRASRVVGDVAEAKALGGAGEVLVELTLESKATVRLRLGAEADQVEGVKQAYVKGAVDGLLYALPLQERTRWASGPELFKRPPAPTAQQMRGLEQLPPEIRAQLEAQLRQQH
jgi:hypothetical protein